jgi:hypothetical protein
MFHITTPVHTLSGLQGNRVDKDSRKRGKVVSLWLEQYAVPMTPALPAKRGAISMKRIISRGTMQRKVEMTGTICQEVTVRRRKKGCRLLALIFA